MNALLDAALSYAARGWPVFPLGPGSKTPMTEHGYKDGSTDPAVIEAWWRLTPNANIGIVTGARSGIWAFDIDVDPALGIDGLATLRDLEIRRGALPETVCQDTPRGGNHRIFRLNGQDVRCRTGVLHGLDVRGTGGYIAAPPSVHPNGMAYRWRDGLEPDETEIVDAPAWLIALVTRPDPVIASPRQSERPSDAYTAAAFGRIIGDLSRAAPSTRNTALNNAALALGHFIGADAIGRGQCEIALRSAALAIGLDEQEIEKTIRSGIEAGLRDPAQMRNGQLRTAPPKVHIIEPDGKTGDEPIALGEWNAGLDIGDIPPRQWLLGNIFCRRFVSSLIGDGAVGKSSLRLAQLLSLAIGRSLTGDHVFCRSRVLLISLEDDRDEMRRRVRAAMIHYHIEARELDGWLYIATPAALGLKLAVSEFGANKPAQLATVLSETIRRLGIDIVSIDPFVKSHGVDENDNNAMDLVIGIIAGMAIVENCAVDALHHVSKGPADPGNSSRARGGGAFAAGARLVYTLSPMNIEEAKEFNIPEGERRSLVRMDPAKVNIAPAASDANWYKLVGVNLGNGTADYPNGDEVAVIEPWEPPDLFADISNYLINQILTAIETGLPDGVRYSDQSAAKERAAWRVIVNHAPSKSEKQARRIIKTWVVSGLISSESYHNPVSRKLEKGLKVANARRPS